MTGIRRCLSVAALVPGLVHAPAFAQTEVWRVEGDWIQEWLGEAIAIVADQDGDGTRDLLVGAPGWKQSLQHGRVLVLSGADLAVLREIDGPANDPFCSAVADAGDVDGDGVTDLFVGNGSTDVARVYSGATGAELLKLTSILPGDHLGACGVGLGDVDGDGLGDFAVGSPNEWHLTGPSGAVRIVSGATGATVHAIFGSAAGARVGGGQRLADAGDVDGDSIHDLALLDAEQATGPLFSVARVMSGATGLELWAARFDQPGYLSFDLASIAAVGDLDGDGIGELAVGGLPNNPFADPCRAFVLSGATGAELLQVDAGAVGSVPSWMVVGAAGDVDGDLLPDFVISTTMTGSGGPIPVMTLARGSDGATIGTITGTPASLFGRDFAAGIDSDGDGQEDLAIGDASAEVGDVNAGELRLAGWPGGNLIARINGRAADTRFRGDLALIDDVDGDGTNDFVAADPRTLSSPDDMLRIHSGRDGSELLRHLQTVVPDGELVALPDLDGDGHDDIAFGVSVDTAAAAVEVRSSMSGALLLQIPGPGRYGSLFGLRLAVGIQPGGAIHLAIGAPRSSAGVKNGGEVQVWDVATGTLLFRKLAAWSGEFLGDDIAWLGDVDGDGVGDWAFAAKWSNAGGPGAGRVVIASGTTGATLQVLHGVAHDQFGEQVVGLGDLDGDGKGDLCASAVVIGTGYPGELRIYLGGTWTLRATVPGLSSIDRYGSALEVLPDVNGDGIGDWLAMGYDPYRVDVRSGATSALLASLPIPSGYAGTLHLATPQPWQIGSADGDAIADFIASDDKALYDTTLAWLIALDDLMFQLDPNVAQANDTVTAAARGGPVGGPVALEFVSMAGAPVGVLVEFATFDSAGIWTTSDTIPPGLAGLSAEFRAWAIGFNGRIVSSPVQTLQFE